MRFLLACSFAVGLLHAQAPGGRAAGGVVFANPGGYGNVAFPGTGRPQAPPSFATSFGAVTAGQQIPLRNGVRGGFRGNGSGVSYAYPVFVGNGYSDNGYEGYGNPSSYAQQQPSITIINSPPAQLAPTVVINQIFAPLPAPDSASEATTHIFQPAPRQELDAASDRNSIPAPHYFLIAYKDHSVYSALAYWIEDKTLHYVTPQQTHNQASLDLIDMDFTKKLNQR